MTRPLPRADPLPSLAKPSPAMPYLDKPGNNLGHCLWATKILYFRISFFQAILKDFFLCFDIFRYCDESIF